jgi:hypothetical protein
MTYLQCFGSGFIQVSGSGFGIRIRIQEVKNDRNRKKREISCFEVLMFSFEGSKASPVAWTSFMEA